MKPSSEFDSDDKHIHGQLMQIYCHHMRVRNCSLL
jgi:hypothetical protein